MRHSHVAVDSASVVAARRMSRYFHGPAVQRSPQKTRGRSDSPLFVVVRKIADPCNCSRQRPLSVEKALPVVALKVAARVRIPLGVLAKALHLQGFLRFRA